jgi:hypothetical protein
MKLTPDPDLLRHLESTQLSSAKLRPYPRRTLGRGTKAVMILLRLYVILSLPIVAYAFLHALALNHN